MCPTRKSSLFQELFGEGVPLWQKLLTLVTFPIWGPLVLVLLVGSVILAGLALGFLIAVDVFDSFTENFK